MATGTKERIASKNPASIYERPAAVLSNAQLTKEEKLELLDQWESDVRTALVATEEGMAGTSDVELRDILAAKQVLTEDAKPQSTGPGKA